MDGGTHALLVLEGGRVLDRKMGVPAIELVPMPACAGDPTSVTVLGAHGSTVQLAGVAWAATVPTPADIEHALSHEGLATGTVRSVRDVCDTDWADEREVTVAVSDRGDGTIRIPNAPWRFAGCDVRTEGEPRYRGEDNHAVLRDLLGLDDERLAELDANGVLSQRVPDRP